jgi:ABC-type uncharacterized transport system ATPase subunit
MREDAMEYPLVTYNKLSKSSQEIFTFLMQNRNSDNEQKIANAEIADRMDKYAQHISSGMKAIIELDMARRGKYNLVMINPNMWFFGDIYSHDSAIKKWGSLEE